MFVRDDAITKHRRFLPVDKYAIIKPMYDDEIGSMFASGDEGRIIIRKEKQDDPNQGPR